jgi:hypothetical protein
MISSRLSEPGIDTAPSAPLLTRRRCTVGAYGVEAVEMVPMTAEQYEQAVSALATLIVNWAHDRKGAHCPTGRHANSA